MQPIDVAIAAFFGGYIVTSGSLGYYFARWYVVKDAGWFEAVSVPIVISLLAIASTSLAMLALELMKGRVSDPYALFGGAILVVYVFIWATGPIIVVTGIVASIALYLRARTVRTA